LRHRWPKSIHCQIEAVFHGIRSIRMSKDDCEKGIRSFGSWEVYRREAHKLADHLIKNGCNNLLETAEVCCITSDYLQEKLAYYVLKQRSLQTLETMLAGISKLEYALNHYIAVHELSIIPLDTGDFRKACVRSGKKQLRKSSRIFSNRAFPDPLKLIEKIQDPIYQLQASLQYEGGLRCEGVGAPSNRRLRNPLTSKGLRGIITDPVTGSSVGIVASIEKGGKETEHFVSAETYQRLEDYIGMNGKLESDYIEYVEAINRAAMETGQYAQGRGSHGLKHNFAQERYYECIANGYTHEQALQQTSLETSHFRMRETLTYTTG
jgi:integrase